MNRFSGNHRPYQSVLLSVCSSTAQENLQQKTLVFVAYMFFIAQCSLYIAIAPLSDRVLGIQEGKIPYYDGLLQDGLTLGRLYNPALMIFWIIL